MTLLVANILESVFYNNNPTETKLTKIRNLQRYMYEGCLFRLRFHFHVRKMKSMANESLENHGEVIKMDFVYIGRKSEVKI